MIILHYIQSMALSSGIIPEYVNILVRSTEQVATSHIVTEKDLGNSPYSFYRNFKHQLELINPDIVHIHGSWNFITACAEFIAHKNGYFTVVSPHGGLSQVKMEQKFWSQRLPRILLYQFRMIHECNMLIVTTPEEEKEMTELKWKRNMALIPNPIINGLSEEQISSLLLSAYRKVIDTNYRERLSTEEELFINACLKVAVLPESQQLPKDFQPPSKDGVSFRRLYLYAHDEQVTDLLIKGAGRLNIAIPQQLDVDTVPRFKIKQKVDKRQVRLFKTTMEILNKQLPQERQGDIEIHHINLRALATIYALLRFNDYDEDELLADMKKFNVLRYSKQLCQTLQDMFQLEDGFIPFKLK